MSRLEHIPSLMNILTNIYKLGGVKQASSDSSCGEIKRTTHTCGRLFAYTMQKVAFVVSICFLLSACQKAELIPSEPKDINTRATNEEIVSDSTQVNVDCDAKGWEGAIDVGFGFGGEEPKSKVNKK